jgi:NAD(P)H-hydrate epimerase
LGKGKLAIRIAEWFCANPDYDLQRIVPVVPEATYLLLSHTLGVLDTRAAAVLKETVPQYSALLIGPGLSHAPETAAFLQRFLGSTRGKRNTGFVPSTSPSGPEAKVTLPPLVIDADGLNILGETPDWPQALPPETILTPHPGEMAILTGLPSREIQAARLEIAERFAAQWGHVVVLKGAFTVIAAPEGRTMVVPVATPALARAGTGDVLAGLIAGLRAQGMGAFESAAAGAWIHAQAGLLAAKRLGSTATVLAGDVLSAAGEVLGQVSAPPPR